MNHHKNFKISSSFNIQTKQKTNRTLKKVKKMTPRSNEDLLKRATSSNLGFKVRITEIGICLVIKKMSIFSIALLQNFKHKINLGVINNVNPTSVNLIHNSPPPMQIIPKTDKFLEQLELPVKKCQNFHYHHQNPWL